MSSLHLCSGEVWLGHVAADFDHLVEVCVYHHTWVRTLTCTDGGYRDMRF